MARLVRAIRPPHGAEGDHRLKSVDDVNGNARQRF
jgi:hypothetical protein